MTLEQYTERAKDMAQHFNQPCVLLKNRRSRQLDPPYYTLTLQTWQASRHNEQADLVCVVYPNEEAQP